MQVWSYQTQKTGLHLFLALLTALAPAVARAYEVARDRLTGTVDTDYIKPMILGWWVGAFSRKAMPRIPVYVGGDTGPDWSLWPPNRAVGGAFERCGGCLDPDVCLLPIRATAKRSKSRRSESAKSGPRGH